MIRGRNTYTFNAAEFARLLGIEDPAAIGTAERSPRSGVIRVMLHGQRPRTFSGTEFTRRLGITDSRRVVTVKWHAQDRQAAVWMEPA